MCVETELEHIIHVSESKTRHEDQDIVLFVVFHSSIPPCFSS